MVFSRRYNLERHRRVHDRTNQTQLCCKHCMKHFTRKDVLKRHIQTVCYKLQQDKDKDNSHLCEYCGCVYKSEKNLERHHVKCLRTFTCKRCNKSFNNNHKLLRHECALKIFPFRCKDCCKGFFSKNSLKRHRKVFCARVITNHSITKTCVVCNMEFNNASIFYNHKRKCRVLNKHKPRNRIYRCLRCSKKFVNRIKLRSHLSRHSQEGSGRALRDEAFLRLYKKNKHIIERGKRRGKLMDEYNYKVDNDIQYSTIYNHLNEIYQEQEYSFKMNISFGYVLRHSETRELRFFYPHQNESILRGPVTISNKKSLRRVKDKLRQTDILQKLFLQRPDTKWTFYRLVSVMYSVFHIKEFPLGHGLLPPFIKKKKCIIGLDTSYNGRIFTDNLCIFRCLAVHRGSKLRKLSTTTKNLFNIYLQKCNKSKETFKGITLSEMSRFEEIFKININIFEMKADETVRVVTKSLGKYPHTMNLNKFNNHLSLIVNLKKYSKKYQCEICDKFFKSLWKMKIHSSKCSDVTNINFPGGYFSLQKNIFERLHDFGINVKEEYRYYKSFAVFDFESYLQSNDQKQSSEEKLKWINDHRPISVSINSNIPNFSVPVCFVDADEDNLLKKMFNHLNDIAIGNSFLLRQKFRKVINRLQYIKEELSEFCDYEMEWEQTCIDDSMHVEEAHSEAFIEAMARPNMFRQYMSKLQFYY